MKPKWLIVIEALDIGQRFEQNGRTYAIGEDGEIVIIATKYTTESEETEEVGLRTDMTLGQFRSLCEKLSDEQIFTLGSGTALTKLNQKARK